MTTVDDILKHSKALGLNTPLQTEKLRVERELLEDDAALRGHIRQFDPVDGWLQTIDVVKRIHKDLNLDELPGQIETAELVDASGASLHVRPAAGGGVMVYRYLPDNDAQAWFYQESFHALDGAPDQALIYRVYFDPYDTRVAAFARLVRIGGLHHD